MSRIKLYRSDHLCETDRCHRPSPGRRICWTCTGRLRRHGDPSIVRIRRNPAGFISYGLAHRLVARERGAASLHVCECGQQAREWSYGHSDPNQLSSPQGHPYSVSPEHYQPRCWPCHRHLDRQQRALSDRVPVEVRHAA